MLRFCQIAGAFHWKCQRNALKTGPQSMCMCVLEMVCGQKIFGPSNQMLRLREKIFLNQIFVLL